MVNDQNPSSLLGYYVGYGMTNKVCLSRLHPGAFIPEQTQVIDCSVKVEVD